MTLYYNLIMRKSASIGRLLIVIVLIGYWLLVIGHFALAETKLKDVPVDHWAASAVYDLIKLGVTNGYPDGTFRGNKPITRYETAMFLSKLSKAVVGEDLKAEIKALRDQLVDLKQESKQSFIISGNYEGKGKFGNVLAARGDERGGAANYRLVMSAKKELAETADFKVNLDTMDFGYNNDQTSSFPGNGLLASELLDIESNLRIKLSDQPINLKITYGPGPKQHAADPTNLFPSEIGMVFWRPSTGILATTKFFGADFKGGFYAVESDPLSTTGRINSGWLTAGLGFPLGKLPVLNEIKVDLIGDYLRKGLANPTDVNTKAKIELTAPITEKIQAGATVGLARAASRMMAAGSLALNDPLDTGTVLTIRAAKIGAEYIDPNFTVEQFQFTGYDNFGRPLINSTVNVGGELVQAVGDRAKLIGKGDVRLSSDYQYLGPNARLTAQGGISYNLAPNVDVDAAYQVFHNKGQGNTSDLAAVGLLYKF